MKDLYVQSLPLKDVILDLAKEFNCGIVEHCDEFVLEIPKEFGNGFIRGINFGKGLGVIEYNCTFFEDLKIHFSVSQIHPLKFIFCSEGSIKHYFEELEQNLKVRETPEPASIVFSVKGKEEIPISTINTRPDGIGYGQSWKLEMKVHPKFAEALEEQNQKGK